MPVSGILKTMPVHVLVNALINPLIISCLFKHLFMGGLSARLFLGSEQLSGNMLISNLILVDRFCYCWTEPGFFFIILELS